MSNEEVVAFNQKVIDEFRSNAGVMPEGSQFHGNPTLLMTMTGARTGRTLTTPLTYTADGNDFIVMASAGGSPTLPAWAHNLRANPAITLEVLDETSPALAVETVDGERQAAFELMVANLPRFGGYQEAVERVIPLFRLQRR